jgi:hypothetical protein
MTTVDPTAINPATRKMYGMDPAPAPSGATPAPDPQPAPADGLHVTGAPASGIDPAKLDAAAAAEDAKVQTLVDEIEAPPAKPYQYTMPTWPNDVPPLAPAERVTLQIAAHAEGLSNGKFQQIVIAAGLAARAAKNEPWESTKQRYVRELESMWGKESWLDKVKIADAEIDRIAARNPQLLAWLENPQLSCSPTLLKIMFDRAQRRASKQR